MSYNLSSLIYDGSKVNPNINPLAIRTSSRELKQFVDTQNKGGHQKAQRSDFGIVQFLSNSKSLMNFFYSSRYSLIVLGALLLGMSTLYANAEDLGMPPKLEFIDIEGNRISYESKKVTDGVNGVIKIYSKNSELLYLKNGLPPPSCSDTEYKTLQILKPRPGWNNRELIVACGDYSYGKNMTLMFITRDGIASTLNFGSAPPSIHWNNNTQTLQASVRHRLLSPVGSLESYLVVYEWNPHGFVRDGFSPIFNSQSKYLYLADYKLWKTSLNESDNRKQPAGALAALISTGSAIDICNEINHPPLSQFDHQELSQMISFNEQYGYPSFDLGICKGK